MKYRTIKHIETVLIESSIKFEKKLSLDFQKP